MASDAVSRFSLGYMPALCSFANGAIQGLYFHGGRYKLRYKLGFGSDTMVYSGKTIHMLI